MTALTLPTFTNGGLILLLLLLGAITVVGLILADEHRIDERLWLDMTLGPDDDQEDR
jgi:hypothetical protein